MYKEPEKHDPVLRKKENSITANTQMTHTLELADEDVKVAIITVLNEGKHTQNGKKTKTKQEISAEKQTVILKNMEILELENTVSEI